MQNVDAQRRRGHPFEGGLGYSPQRFCPLVDEIDRPEDAHAHYDLRRTEAVIQKSGLAFAEQVDKGAGKQDYISRANPYSGNKILERDLVGVGEANLVAGDEVGDVGDEHCENRSSVAEKDVVDRRIDGRQGKYDEDQEDSLL